MRAPPATDQEPTEAEREQHPERWWPEDERADGPDRDGETRNEYGEEPVTLREEPDEERDQPEIAQRLRAPRLTHRWGRRVHGPAAHCDGRHPSISNEPRSPEARDSNAHHSREPDEQHVLRRRERAVGELVPREVEARGGHALEDQGRRPTVRAAETPRHVREEEARRGLCARGVTSRGRIADDVHDGRDLPADAAAPDERVLAVREAARRRGRTAKDLRRVAVDEARVEHPRRAGRDRGSVERRCPAACERRERE